MTEEAAAQDVANVLRYLGEDPARAGLRRTPVRVVRALREMTAGYAQDPKDILATTFDEAHDQLVTLDHVEFVSLCEHHLLSFMGQAHVGYIPGSDGRVVGVSKLARLVDCFARRLQVQERMTRQIADAIVDHLAPLGVAVVVEARHSCICARGVGKQRSVMRTSVMRGVFLDKPEARAEFLTIIGRGG